MVVKDRPYRNPKNIPTFNDPDEQRAIRDALRFYFQENLKIARQVLISQFFTALFVGALLVFEIALWLRG